MPEEISTFVFVGIFLSVFLASLLTFDMGILILLSTNFSIHGIIGSSIFFLFAILLFFNFDLGGVIKDAIGDLKKW